MTTQELIKRLRAILTEEDMDLQGTLRRIRACGGEAAAQLVLEYLIAYRVAEEREACAKACEAQEVHDIGHPGTAFNVQAMCINAIRERSNADATTMKSYFVAEDDLERLSKGNERYETARRMNPMQWSAAWELNITTGKPFDEIIDNMRPFVYPTGDR